MSGQTKQFFGFLSGQTVFGYGLDMGLHVWRDIRHLLGLCLDRQFCVRVYSCRFACLDRQTSFLGCAWTDSFVLWFIGLHVWTDTTVFG